LSIVVQSSTYLPAYLEERCLNWLGAFREELNVMTNDRIIMEATAVVAQLTERNIRFRDEVCWMIFRSDFTVSRHRNFRTSHYLLSSLYVNRSALRGVKFYQRKAVVICPHLTDWIV